MCAATWNRQHIAHLIVLCFASSLLWFLLFFALGRSASVAVGPSGQVPLLGLHSHTQAVVCRFAVFVGVGRTSDRTGRMSVKKTGIRLSTATP